MRILLTTDTVGGVWTFTRELSLGLLEHGHDVALVSFGREPSREQSCWSEGMSSRFGPHFRHVASAAPLEWMSSNESAYAEGERTLLRLASRFAPDLLHSNQFCFGALPLGCAKIVTAHSDVLSWAEICRPEGLERSPWLTTYLRLVQQGLNAANIVTAPTRWMLDALRKNFSIPGESRVIANGRSVYAPRDAQRTLQAVSVGRLWDEAKNVSMLAAIDSPVPLVISGELNFEHHSQQPFKKIRCTGPLSETALLKLFASSSIYIASSRYEPFGLAPVEAALCGCAVLANDIPSFHEVWGDAALYFNDAASLSALLRALARDAARLHEIQRRSAARALTFSRDRMVEGYLRLYSEAAAPVLPWQRTQAAAGELAAYA